MSTRDTYAGRRPMSRVSHTASTQADPISFADVLSAFVAFLVATATGVSFAASLFYFLFV